MINNWKYNSKDILKIDDMKIHEPKVWGFVYLLSLYDSKGNLKYQYIGKKNLYSVRTKYLTQAEIKSVQKKSELKRKKTKSGFKYYKTVITESDWLKYISSNLFIKKNSGKFRIEREILKFSTNDSDLSYQEAKEILCRDTLDDPMFLNNGISIRRFSNKIII